MSSDQAKHFLAYANGYKDVLHVKNEGLHGDVRAQLIMAAVEEKEHLSNAWLALAAMNGNDKCMDDLKAKNPQVVGRVFWDDFGQALLVNSLEMTEIAYVPSQDELHVCFDNDSIKGGCYESVDLETFGRFISSNSLGDFLQCEIKPKYLYRSWR